MRVPPHNLEAEESLLGAMMLNRDALYAVIAARIEGTDFYKPAHGWIFDAIKSLIGRGEAVDPMTVANELSIAGRPVDQSDLMRIQNAGTISLDATTQARIVMDAALGRKLIEVAGRIGELGYERANVGESIDEAERLLLEVADRRLTDRTVRLDDSIQAVMNRLDRIGAAGFAGVSTGFKGLDQMILGLQPAALYVLAARPAMGKSACALCIADHVASIGKPALVFSLEMEHEDLTSRLLAGEARVDARRLWDGDLSEAEWKRINAAVGRIESSPLFFDDDPTPTLLGLRAKARRIKARYGLGLVVVDYVQLMHTKAENRQQQVDEITRTLKVMARELQVPVLALSQLNREVERRADKRPTLADLRDSGAIEQHADVVAFIYRDEIYNPDSPDRGTAELIVAKHRNGPTGTVRLAFQGRFMKFEEMAA